MEQQGFSHDQCLDFDFTVVDFWADFYEPTAEERQKVKLPSSQQLKPGQGWVPRYKTRDEIFKLWLKQAEDGSDDPIALAADLDAIYDDWDPDESFEDPMPDVQSTTNEPAR